jgi:hypothetical protein
MERRKSRSLARNTRPAEGVAEDLLIFRARMEDCGVKVRLPTAGPDYRLPEPITVEGEPLSETVIRLRDGQA